MGNMKYRLRLDVISWIKQLANGNKWAIVIILS